MLLWWDWRDRVTPECDEGSSPVQANELRSCDVGNESRLFFNPALGHDRFHGGLGAAAIQKFHIGSEVDISRRAPTATAAVLAVLGSELNGAGDSAASVSAAFGPAAEGFAERAAIVIGGEEPEPSGVERIFHVPCAIAPTHMKLFERLAVKLAFNNVSTATMGCMGRLVGNWMAFVDTSNKKLIDRGSRLVSELAEVDYETACYALHETNEMLRTTLSPGDEKPSPVALTIERLQQPPLEPRTS